jgi:hypothetical protein
MWIETPMGMRKNRGGGTKGPVRPVGFVRTSADEPEEQTTMTKNMGSIDRIVRAAAAVVLIVVAAVVGLDRIGGIVALALGVVMGGTAAVGFCPLYVPLHLDTCRHAR